MPIGKIQDLISSFTLKIFIIYLIFNVNASLIKVTNFFVRLALQNQD